MDLPFIRVRCYVVIDRIVIWKAIVKDTPALNVHEKVNEARCAVCHLLEFSDTRVLCEAIVYTVVT